MRAKDMLPHGFVHHSAQPGTELTPCHGDEEGNLLLWANEACDAFPSNWEAAWIDLGGEG